MLNSLQIIHLELTRNFLPRPQVIFGQSPVYILIYNLLNNGNLWNKCALISLL